MEAREDLQWRRETPGIWEIGEPPARRGTHREQRDTGNLALGFFVFLVRAEIGILRLQAVALDLAIER